MGSPRHEVALAVGLCAVVAVTVWEFDRIAGLQGRQRQLALRLEAVQSRLDAAFGDQPANRTGGSRFVGRDPISIGRCEEKGSAHATAVVIEFADFQCPFCVQHFRDVLGELEREYVAPGKIRYVFCDLPLEMIHPSAFGAATGAVCAAEQSRFWEMHDRLFRRPQRLHSVGLRAHAKALDLDLEMFGRCLSSTGPARVRSQVEEARRLGITSTPTFLVGLPRPDGRVDAIRRLSGAVPFAAFKRALDDLPPSRSGR